MIIKSYTLKEDYDFESYIKNVKEIESDDFTIENRDSDVSDKFIVTYNYFKPKGIPITILIFKDSNKIKAEFILENYIVIIIILCVLAFPLIAYNTYLDTELVQSHYIALVGFLFLIISIVGLISNNISRALKILMNLARRRVR
jgi:hypothetical protein